MRISAITLLWILFGSGLLTAEQAPGVPPEKAEPGTIKTSSRFVVLDVLVTGKLGQPVHGLKPQDFVVLEDGKVQQVRGFEERGPNLAPPHPAPVLNLPPDTYTNYVSVQPPGAMNILLFDMLNTDRQGLAMARQQLLLYLSKVPANTQVALYTLDSTLHLVHGFTDDPSQLIAFAKHLSNKPHPMFSQARDVSASVAMAQELIMDPVVLSHTIQFLWSDQQGKEESRTLITMQALEQLARSVAVVPGRKNLVWISGGIPFDTVSTAPEMRHLTSTFAATQIAVYPVDVRGIPYLGADASAYDKEAFGGNYETTSGQASELISVHETMMTLANMTGGHAQYNRNDLGAAIGESIDSGSNYYVLAYRPSNNNWNGKFRKVSVKTVRPDLKVQCRPGYYGVADPLGSQNIDRTFSLAMQPGVPAATSLIFKTRVRPPSDPEKPADLDFLVDVNDLSFTEVADHHKQPDVMFVATLWDADGHPAGSQTARFFQPLNSAQLESLVHTGLQLHQQLQSKPGAYQLRLGVVDRLSGRMGTLEVPLKIDGVTVKQTGGVSLPSHSQ